MDSGPGEEPFLKRYEVAIGEQWSLTDLRGGDRAALVEGLNNLDVSKQLLVVPSPYTLRDAKEFIAYARDQRFDNGWPENYAIRENASGLVIGGFGFTPSRSGHSDHRSMVGYWLAEPYWGQGIVTAVLRTASDLARDTLGLTKLTANVFVGNGASERVLAKAGFEKEGFSRRHYEKDGIAIDVSVWGKLL